ncbi:MAG TPA: hypothetical protein VGF89_04045 [Steroidobacteraceae bacterium]
MNHAHRPYVAAPAPKRLPIFNGGFDDGFGGHIDALCEHGELLLPAPSTLMGVPLSAHWRCYSLPAL